MPITRYEPWSLLHQLHRELDRAREGTNGDGSSATAEWAPAVDIKEEADKLFNGLSAGGEIEMPISDSPWSTYFGMFRDKYGIEWMVDYDPKFNGKA